MMRLFFGLVFLSLILPGISRGQEREPVQQIKSLMESCQFSQAVGLAELFLSRDSTRTDLLLLKGRSLAAMYQYREAVAALGKAILTDSTDITVLNELVNVYRMSGDPEEAIAVARRLIELSPGNRYFALQLANLCYSAEDYPGALQVFGALYRSDSNSYYIARQLGNCYNELRRSDSAIRFYRRALRISPYDQYVTGTLVNVLIVKTKYPWPFTGHNSTCRTRIRPAFPFSNRAAIAITC
jgi:tetratricopeptide (TPR) repeat protein